MRCRNKLGVSRLRVDPSVDRHIYSLPSELRTCVYTRCSSWLSLALPSPRIVYYTYILTISPALLPPRAKQRGLLFGFSLTARLELTARAALPVYVYCAACLLLSFQLHLLTFEYSITKCRLFIERQLIVLFTDYIDKTVYVCNNSETRGEFWKSYRYSLPS